MPAPGKATTGIITPGGFKDPFHWNETPVEPHKPCLYVEEEQKRYNNPAYLKNKQKHSVISCHALPASLVPATLAWANGYPYLTLLLALYYWFTVFEYWGTPRAPFSNHTKASSIPVDLIVTAIAGILTYIFVMEKQHSNETDPVSAQIWWSMCMFQAFLQYISARMNCHQAVYHNNGDRFLYQLHYRINFHSTLLMTTILAVTETTYDQYLLFLGATFLAGKMFELYGINMNMGLFISLQKTSFPYLFQLGMAAYTATYFYFFGPSATTRSIEAFSFYYSVSLGTLLLIFLPIHFFVVRLCASGSQKEKVK